MNNHYEDIIARIGALEIEVHVLRLAVSALAQQDIEILTAGSSSDSEDRMRAFDQIRENLRSLGFTTSYKRKIGELPEEGLITDE